MHDNDKPAEGSFDEERQPRKPGTINTSAFIRWLNSGFEKLDQTEGVDQILEWRRSDIDTR